MPDKIPDRSTLNEEDFKAMMERIEASNAGQEKYAKKQYRMSQITALCSILVSSSEDSVQNALNQLNSIDIDTLNQAINHLNDTVTPFANFFNKFR